MVGPVGVFDSASALKVSVGPSEDEVEEDEGVVGSAEAVVVELEDGGFIDDIGPLLLLLQILLLTLLPLGEGMFVDDNVIGEVVGIFAVNVIMDVADELVLGEVAELEAVNVNDGPDSGLSTGISGSGAENIRKSASGISQQSACVLAVPAISEKPQQY